MNYVVLVCVVYIAVFLAAIFIYANYAALQKLKDGTDRMKELAGIISSGAETFMKREYKVIVPVAIAIAVIFSLFIEVSSGITFLLGALMSSIGCVLGMIGAVKANVKTANTARETLSIGSTVQTALSGGIISGITIHAAGLLGLATLIIISGGFDLTRTGHGLLTNVPQILIVTRVSTYSLGCSVVAMFNRIAGGNYTKAADISADIVGKTKFGLDEDDSKNPNTIADFIGDNVNDIAGNCSDLLESFVATLSASILIVSRMFTAEDVAFQQNAYFYPVLLATMGLVGCLIGLLYAIKHKAGDDPAKELNIATYLSAGLTMIFGLALSYYFFNSVAIPVSFKVGWVSPFIAATCGIISGVGVGRITEIYTSTEYRYVKGIAQMSTEGPAFVVTKGDEVGSRSCLAPVALIGVAVLISYLTCGFYGLAISSVGMLAFVGAIVSQDAFGPIADNAGGIAESCELDPHVREITDNLDAVGNTTAAIGKGLAIGSAAMATVALIFAYVSSYMTGDIPDLNFASPLVVVGGLIGGALVEFFSALLTGNTIDSAYLMAEEGVRQLSKPGVIEGKVKPDYNHVIDMAANEALRKMLTPSLIAMIVPVVSGFLFGPEFVGGLLVGMTIVAVPRAIFMGNSGGAYDNAKKYVESGRLEYKAVEYDENGNEKEVSKIAQKGSEEHKATVVGDTVGDTRKDVVGVALDIFIKTSSTVANTMAPMFAHFHIF
ncbi:MAG: sodium-translocating pyrophosphatase [Lachnospiraceae bacterium]|nr:sodium-translocating pyrophosphatase [Lachnospiraceae bacterium]